MKYNKIFIASLAVASIGAVSCSDDVKAPGNPVMDVKTEFSNACFGDSLAFTINASDNEVPLSTIHADLFFGDERVSQTVIRTKDSGRDYEGKIYVPYYANIPEGRATLKLTLQNIHFTITEKEYLIPITYPDFEYLTFVSDDADNPGEYRMDKVSRNIYAVTNKFPQKIKGHIMSPIHGENGNELRYGYESNQVKVGGEGSIPFANSKAGEYTITLDISSLEATPFIIPSFGNVEFVGIDEDRSELTANFAQGQRIEANGFPNISEWWLDPDYFVLNDDDSLTFLPVSGRYRVVADMDKLYFCVYALNSDGEYATFGGDGKGIWLMGWGVGSPSMSQQFGWTPGASYNVAQIASGVYQFSGNAGPEHGSEIGDRFRTDYLDFKFFHQDGWGGEFSGSTALELTDEAAKLLKRNDGNYGLADGVNLENGAMYVLTIDTNAGVINFKKI